MEPKNNIGLNSTTYYQPLPPETVNIRKMYLTREYLKYPQMVKALKDVLRGRTVTIQSNFFEREKRGLRRRASRCFRQVTLKFKVKFSIKYRNRVATAAVKLADQFFEQKKVLDGKSNVKENVIHKPINTPNPHQDLLAKIETVGQALLQVEEEIKAKNESLDQNRLKQKQDCPFVNGDTYREAFELRECRLKRLEQLRKELKEAEEYANSYVGSFQSWFSSNPQDEVKRLSEEIQELKKEFDEDEAGFNILKTKKEAQEGILKEYQVEEKKLSSEITELMKQRELVQTESGVLQQKLAEATGALTLIPATDANAGTQNLAKVERLNFGSPEENFNYVVSEIERSIYSSSDTDKVKGENLRRTLGYLKKPKKTSVLEMSGIEDEQLVMQKSAMAVRILALALTEEKNNERLVSVVVGFLNSLLSINQNVENQDKEKIADLLRFAFEIDPETKQPRMDEAFRFRALSIIMGCVLILSHYFFDENSLKMEIRAIKRLLSLPWIGAAAMKGAYALKRNQLINSIKDVPIFQDSHKQGIDTLVTSLEPVIREVLSGGSSSKMKEKMMKATRIFADKDFKPFMEFVDFDNLPTTSELTEACASLFENFIKNLENA